MLILHLSDIHLKKDEEQFSFLPMFEAVKDKIFSTALVSIIISGDIAFSGQNEEYDLFHSKIEELLEAIYRKDPQKKINILICPGNHDCNFQMNNRVRKIVVSSIQENGLDLDLNDLSDIDIATSIQDGFFDYLALLRSEKKKQGLNRVFWQDKVEEDSCSLLVTTYNTSWLSDIQEKPGSLYYPHEVFNSINNSGTNDSFKVGVYHHPDNWISPSHDEHNHREFRNHITRFNNLVLCGHEHRENLDLFKDLSNGDECVFHASQEYYNGSNLIGFSTIEIDKDGKGCVDEYTYDCAQKCFIIGSTIPTSLNKSGPFFHMYDLKDEFANFLSDTEVTYTSSNNEKLSLKEIFVYPKLENIDIDSEIIDSTRILKDQPIGNTIIFGQDQSGKTALLKIIFSHWYYHSSTPLYIDCKTSLTNTNVRQLIKNTYRKQYNASRATYDQYMSLSSDKKLILLDNFHLTKPRLDKGEILDKFMAHSDNILITADDVSSLDEASLGDNIRDFSKYIILAFGHQGRDLLIEKWLKSKYYEKEDLFSRKVELHHQMNNILGSNLVPSFPIYILTILQAITIDSPSKMEVSSSGHCYQAIIYLSFRTLGLKDSEYDAIDNFLAYLAYCIYNQKSGYFTNEVFCDLHQEYLKHYIIMKDPQVLLELLIKAKIIELDSLGNYCFKYEYIYYYYIAKYLANDDILDSVLDSGLIEKLCSNVDSKTNSSILLFLTHHSNKMRVVEEIIINTMGLLDEIDPITLVKSETDKLFGSTQQMSDYVIENISPEEYHDKQLQMNDEVERNKSGNQKEYDVNENLIQINKAFKSIEINGQILKYKSGKIDKTRLKYIIEESFLISFRLVRFLIEDLSNEETQILLTEHFLDILIKENKQNKGIPKKIPTREELFKLINKTLSSITYFMCHYTLDKTATFLGSNDLLDEYLEISKKIDTPAARLTYTLIKFKFNQRIDKAELEKLESEFKNNAFAYSILQKSAINFIYMHELSHQDKNWIANKLSIKVRTQRQIENRKNK